MEGLGPFNQSEEDHTVIGPDVLAAQHVLMEEEARRADEEQQTGEADDE